MPTGAGLKPVTKLLLVMLAGILGVPPGWITPFSLCG